MFFGHLLPARTVTPVKEIDTLALSSTETSISYLDPLFFPLLDVRVPKIRSKKMGDETPTSDDTEQKINQKKT